MNDVTQADRLVMTVSPTTCKGIVGDRAYDSNALLRRLGQLGVEAVIPPRANRIVPRTIAQQAYRKRNVIERWFGRAAR